MDKKKYALVWLQIFSLIFLVIFGAFFWRDLLIRTTTLEADYALHYHVLHNAYLEKIYQYQISTPVIHIKKINNREVIQKKSVSAYNVNSPLASLIMKILMNGSENLSINLLIYIVISLLGVIISAHLFLFREKSLNTSPWLLPLSLCILMSWPGIMIFVFGQFSFVFLPLLIGAYLLDTSKQYFLSATMLGLLGTLKFFFLIFILLFLVRHQWRYAGIFLLSFICFFFLPLIYFPWHIYMQFFHIMLSKVPVLQGAVNFLNGSTLGFLIKIFAVSGPVNFLNLSIALRVSMILLPGGFIISWILYDYFYLRKLPYYVNAIRFSFLIILALLCSPLGWVYYTIFMVIPVAVIIEISTRYQLSKLCMTLFFSTFILMYGTWVPYKNFMLYQLSSYSAFAVFLFALFTLIAASHSVKRAIPANQLRSQTKMILIGIFIISLLNIVLLWQNFGLDSVLKWDKTLYLEKNIKGNWIT